MFIMWGSKLREKELGSAEFNCPQCRGNEEYAHVSLSRWFTLYLLPLYEIESIGEFVKCLRCKQLYPMEILSGLEAYPAGFVPVPRSTDTAAKVVVIVHGDSLGPRLIRLKPLERELSLLPGEKCWRSAAARRRGSASSSRKTPRPFTSTALSAKSKCSATASA
jgi:hypothetical protein